MSDIEFQKFAYLVLGLDSTHKGMGTGSKGPKQRNHSFVKMLLANFATITNLHPVIHNKIANNQQALASALACCTLLLTGSDPLTPSIIQRVWGAHNTIRKTLGRPRRDLALIRQPSCCYPKLPSTHTTCGQLPTLTIHASSTMTPCAAIIQAPEASSNPSRIQLLANTSMRPWHWAPYTLTFC